MLFSTVVAFVTYSLVYFVVSQRKMRKLRNSIVSLSRENSILTQKARAQKGSVAVMHG